jgi:branched-chain amino acid transport system ATP-binding protein
MTLPLLVVDDLAVGYRGGGLGVSGVSFELGRGEAVALVGPNGAGKSSTLRGITGVLRRDPAQILRGRVLLDGRDVTRLGPRERAAAGIAMVPEEQKIFAGLDVSENLRLAVRAPRRQAPAVIEEALAVFPQLSDHLDRKAGLLSGGQRQMLAIAGALCMRPEVLVVDELTLGLSPEFVETMVDALRGLVAGGLPMVVAEQNIAVAKAIAGSVIVLHAGREVGREDLRSETGAERLRAAFLGGEEVAART